MELADNNENRSNVLAFTQHCGLHQLKRKTIFLESTSPLNNVTFTTNLKLFLKIWVDYTEKSPAISILPFPDFLCLFPIFPTHFSTSFLIWSIHLVLGLLLGCLPSISLCNIFLCILSSLICITCPYNLNLFF